MADLSVEALDLRNPFVIAASPATQGAFAVLKSARSLPGAVTMRNYGHGAGDGSLVLPSTQAMRTSKDAMQIHAMGASMPDPAGSLEAYCETVTQVRQEMPEQVKLWVSIGHFNDLLTPGTDWQAAWSHEAVEVERAGADAVELHFNTPGVVVAGNRFFDYYRLVYTATRIIKNAVHIPVMVKLAIESCDPLKAMEAALHADADAIGPTARWKGFVFDLDWRRSPATPGGGYGGSQALPIISYIVAEARLNNINAPMYAGGGVFNWQAAAKLIMAGSQCIQLGSFACCLGPTAVSRMIAGFSAWMNRAGYPDIDALCGDALGLFSLSAQEMEERQNRLSSAYRVAQPDADLCTRCQQCLDVCWYDAISMRDNIPVKSKACVGCGYCFQVCPTGALHVPVGDILSQVM